MERIQALYTNNCAIAMIACIQCHSCFLFSCFPAISCYNPGYRDFPIIYWPLPGGMKMIRTRIVRLTMVLASLSMLLAACAAPAAPPAAPTTASAANAPAAATQAPAAQGAKVTITFWKHNHDPADALTKTLIDEYQKANPN